MDLAAAKHFFDRFKRRTDKKAKKEGFMSPAASTTLLLVELAVASFAAYLSWSCNTAAGIDVALKVLYAFFAFVFGFVYLIFYVIFRVGTCHAR